MKTFIPLFAFVFAVGLFASNLSAFKGSSFTSASLSNGGVPGSALLLKVVGNK